MVQYNININNSTKSIPITKFVFNETFRGWQLGAYNGTQELCTVADSGLQGAQRLYTGADRGCPEDDRENTGEDGGFSYGQEFSEPVVKIKFNLSYFDWFYFTDFWRKVPICINEDGEMVRDKCIILVDGFHDSCYQWRFPQSF